MSLNHLDQNEKNRMVRKNCVLSNNFLCFATDLARGKNRTREKNGRLEEYWKPDLTEKRNNFKEGKNGRFFGFHMFVYINLNESFSIIFNEYHYIRNHFVRRSDWRPLNKEIINKLYFFHSSVFPSRQVSPLE